MVCNAATGRAKTANAMPARYRLSPDGPEFSRIAYGTWRLMEGAHGPAEILDRFKACVDAGVTTIDTAEIYGLYAVEEAIGNALALEPSFRSRIEIATKCGIYLPCPAFPSVRSHHYDATAARIVESAEKSLRLLRTDRIDLLMVHRPDWFTAADETAEGLNSLLRSGKVLAVGASNFNTHQVELLNSRLDRPLAVNQIEFSLLHTDPMEDGTLDQCQRLRIHPMAWSPLGGGRLFADGDPAATRLQKAAAELSGKHGGASLDQLACAWVLAHPSRPVAVIGTNNTARIQAAAAAAGIELGREDFFALWSAAKGLPIP
jgi:predicted oxidoreductase